MAVLSKDVAAYLTMYVGLALTPEWLEYLPETIWNHYTDPGRRDEEDDS